VRIDRSERTAQQAHGSGSRPGSVSIWVMLIKRVCEADPSMDCRASCWASAEASVETARNEMQNKRLADIDFMGSS